MGDHDYPATCLSSVEHGRDVRDVVLHYFGCLRENERAIFFDSLPSHKKQRIKDEERRIGEQRAVFEVGEETKYLVKRFRTSLGHYVKRALPSHSSAGLLRPCQENGYGLNAYAVFFKNSERFSDKSCSDQFPNQKIPVRDLLYNKQKETNPLMRDCGDDEIRYFHLPGNNMEWIEEAIARHYNEERPEYDGLFRRPETPSKTYMLLRPEYWRGQQHGGRHDAVHARHMRPRCDIVSTDPDNLEDSPKNLVLFMPYLHWETDRRRAKFDEMMRNITERHRKEEAKKFKKTKYIPLPAVENGNLKSRLAGKKRAKAANGNATTSEIEMFGKDAEANFHMINTATEVIDAKFRHEMENRPKSKFSKTKFAKTMVPGILAPKTVLGQVLHRAAILSEAMDYYQEHELLKYYLHKDPPFHPRRTLDQSYYWTLKTTKKRDRDQVVYRGTAPRKEFMHRGSHCKSGCQQCLDDIRKVPRVVMVDQLWLWILDGKTIITSFPKRYGRNKPDPSAVHKSIRLRLKVSRRNEIRSAFDLALIIIDQCSRVFFDRTKTADRQPQVMDLFASAIGNVTNRQTIAYDHFWATTQEASKIYKDKDTSDEIEEKTKSLLDINPEGKLLREIKDILDELHIMINIKNKQQRVFKEFKKHVLHVIDPGLAMSKEIGTARPRDVRGNADEGETDQSGKGKKPVKNEDDQKSQRDAKWTIEFALDLSAGLDDRIVDLNNLKESAEHTEKALDGLLALKQQQASVVQAREAVRQAEETLRQGRSIMLFTVITIIFLPLSFGASLFGMNTIEFNSGPWTLRREITFMFPISIIVILTSFILAFSSFTRAFLAFVVGLAWTKFVTSTRIYSLWIQFKTNSHTLTKMRKEKTRKWKEEARAAKQKRREEKQKRKEEKRVKEEEERRQKGQLVPGMRPDDAV